MLFDSLDTLTSGGFTPYRDGSGRVRLFDAYPLRKPRASAESRNLQKLALAVLEAAVDVETEEQWRAWYDGPCAKFWDAWFQCSQKLGLCAGDEGHEWGQIVQSLQDAVHRPSWALETVPLTPGERVHEDTPRPGTVVRSGSTTTLIAWDPCACSWCEAGKSCLLARGEQSYEVSTDALR